jgi:putative oxidoreductase
MEQDATSDMYIQFHWILLWARIVLASVMIYYGWPKIRDLNANAHEFAQMGFKPPMVWGTLIAVVEFVGGIAVLLGFFAELASALFGFQMLVGTFWKLKIKKAFTDYSYDLQLFALCLVIMSQGAGVLAPAAFPGFIFLRWDVAVAALAAALLFAALCKPQFTASQAAKDKQQWQEGGRRPGT